EALAYLTANRDYLVDYVQQNLPGIYTTCPEGTYLAWLDCRELGLEPSPHQFLLDKARVGFNDGKAFGQGGEGFVRVNYGCPRATLTEALERVRAALQG
ncbi:MAG: putative C-S lyase, partial [Anaerolineaceae bacterium]|nr:putative C-S lyase [Anaerolineaceae bacterium]